jgi:chromosome segregation ATPase
MTVERLNLKQAAAKYGVGRRSQARHRLADLNAQAAKLTDRQTKLETRVRKAEACRAAVAGAEAELRGALFEAEVDGSPLPKARLAQLRQAITDARAGATDTAEAETEIAGVLGD